jgi:hypothetical protein
MLNISKQAAPLIMNSLKAIISVRILTAIIIIAVILIIVLIT